MHALPPRRQKCASTPHKHLRQGLQRTSSKVGLKLFFQHHFDAKKSYIPTSVLGMARARDFLSQNYFFTKLTALNPDFAYFLYNSNLILCFLACWSWGNAGDRRFHFIHFNTCSKNIVSLTPKCVIRLPYLG